MKTNICVSTSVADPGCLSRTEDPVSDFFHTGSQIQVDKIPGPGSGFASKNLSIFTLKTDEQFLKNKILDIHPGSRIMSGFFSSPDPGSGSRGQKSPGSRPQMALAYRRHAISQGPKVSISRALPPPTCPRNGCCPHQMHYAFGHINHRCINSHNMA